MLKNLSFKHVHYLCSPVLYFSLLAQACLCEAFYHCAQTCGNDLDLSEQRAVPLFFVSDQL